MSFVFTEENIEKAKKQIEKYPKGKERSAIKSILNIAQKQNEGWLSKDCIAYVAHFLNLPVIQVLEIVSFYNMFYQKQVGKNHVKICRTTPCWLRGADEIKSACQNYLGINIGDITSDKMFSLEEVECLGACVNAPVIQINNDYFEDLDEKSVCNILSKLADDEQIKAGSAIGRKGSKAHNNAK